MRFISAELSKTGGRDINQDCCAFKSGNGSGIWIVADGLGGHRGGEVASQAAVSAILEQWTPDLELTMQSMTNFAESAQSAILEQQQISPRLSSMRTTLVMLAAYSDEALWAHVGDSRLYHFRDCAVVFQTRDHSVPQTLVDAGEIKQEQVRTHPDRNRILRAVGNPDGLKSAISDTPRKIRQGDVFLLCTDGFWEYITETEMSVDLAKSVTPEEWLDRMEMRLLDRVPPDNDNYTALAVFIVA